MSDYVWQAKLIVSDGVNAAVRLPTFEIHVENLLPIMHNTVSDINITVP